MAESDSKLEVKLEEIERKIEEYTSSKGLSETNKVSIDEVREYLEMDRKELRSLSEEDCGEVAWVLGQTSLSIQRELNEQSAIIKWLEAQITKTIMPSINNYKAYSYVERKDAAVYDNTYAIEANRLKVRAEMRTTSLQYIAQEIKNLSSIILGIRDTKRRYKENA